MRTKWTLFFLVACLISGCGYSVQIPSTSKSTDGQGPTGDISFPAESSRESYLIPPEIPTSLVTYIFTRRSNVRNQGEILAISVRDQSRGMWTLEILREAFPDQITTEVLHFKAEGATWREM